MTNELAKQELNSALEEIRAIFTEAEFASRWIIIEAHHKIGQIILSLPGTVAENVHTVADQTGRGERTLWYGVKFAQMYKTVDELPEGKNASWRTVVRDHLTTANDKKYHVHTLITICSVCKMKI